MFLPPTPRLDAVRTRFTRGSAAADVTRAGPVPTLRGGTGPASRVRGGGAGQSDDGAEHLEREVRKRSAEPFTDLYVVVGITETTERKVDRPVEPLQC